MSRTFLRPDIQIRNTATYDDTVAAGATLESGSANIEDDLNGLRSQVKRVLFADSAGDWFSDVPTVNAKKRGLNQLNTDLDDIEEKRFLFRSQVLTDVSVPASQNWVVLSVTGSEAPTENAASDATGIGAVCKGDEVLGAHSLGELTGANAISPHNLCIIRDSATGDDLLSGGKRVLGLLQTEQTAGANLAFDDTSAQVQISFVRENAAGDDLEAVPVADIENASINYSYVRRLDFDSVPQDAFLTGSFVDQSAAVDVTLDNAIDNQSGAATQAQDIDIQITDTFAWSFQDPAGAVDILSVKAAAGADEVEVNGDLFDVNSTDVDFAEGVKVDSAGTQLNLGTTAGQIDSAGALTLASGGAADLTLSAANEIAFVDGNKAGSTFAGDFLLTATSTEWDDLETQFGEVSLASMLIQASTAAARGKTVGEVTGAISADTNVTGAGGTPNIDAQLGDYSGVTFVDDVDVYLNGQLLRNGATAGADHDVYPGDSPANGDLKFEFQLRPNDVITMVIHGA